MNYRVKEILELISKTDECYVVGGYVRDYLLGINSSDYDICTNASIDELKEILNQYKYTIELNTLFINFDDVKIDITPYRKEYKYFNRRPILYEKTDKLIDDLKRRDFTINTICMDINNNIIDLFNGKQDIDDKIIKCVGNTEKKLIDDPLRILRAIRLSAYLNFKIEKNLESAIKKYGYLLKKLSYDIKKRELDKIIEYRGLDIVKRYQIDQYLDIDLSNIKYYKYDILTWLGIDYLNKYCITKKEKNIAKNINNLRKSDIDNYKLYILGADMCDLIGNYFDLDLKSRYNKLPIKSRKDVAISSNEILNIINDNKMINDVYRMIEQNILNGIIINKKENIIDYLNEKYDKI